jgi:hypothetical protein
MPIVPLFLARLFGAGRRRVLLRTLILVGVFAVTCFGVWRWGGSFWLHTKVRIAGGSVWVRSGVEGGLSPAVLADPEHVRAIFFDSSTFDDRQMRLLKQYFGLRRLGLSRTRVTDAGIKDLECHALTELRLRATHVDDEGVGPLADRFPLLSELDLGETHVTDQAVHHLCDFQRLCEVYLDGTSVSDKGLMDLAKAPQSLTVFLTGTRVTWEGVQALRRTRPDIRCVVEPEKSR